MEEFTKSSPAQAGYAGGDLSNLDQVLTDLLDTDPAAGAAGAEDLLSRRLPGCHYAEGFLAAARRYLDAVPQDQPAARDTGG
jgi:hypothetical protein